MSSTTVTPHGHHMAQHPEWCDRTHCTNAGHPDDLEHAMACDVESEVPLSLHSPGYYGDGEWQPTTVEVSLRQPVPGTPHVTLYASGSTETRRVDAGQTGDGQRDWHLDTWLHLTPAEARALAARLVAMADVLEGGAR